MAYQSETLGRLSFLNFALKYSSRSLGRHRRRTILTISTVIFAAAVSIVSNRYTAAIMSLWAEGACDTGLGHLQVHRNGYWQKQEGIQKEFLLKAGSPFENEIRRYPQYEADVRRLRFEGIISSGKKTVYFLGIGTEPAQEAKVSSRLFGGSDQGTFLVEGDSKGIVLGKGLAESLKVTLGDSVTLMAPTALNSVDARDFVVRGIVNVPIPSFSQRVIYIPLIEAQKLVKIPGEYSEFVVRLKKSSQSATAQKDLSPRLSTESLETRTWYEVEPTIRSIEKIFNAVIGMISLLLFLSASLSVLNIVMILVAERTVEIGTLMALGSRPRDIRRLFSFEAALIGACGGVGGLILGCLVVQIMNVLGVPFKSPFSSEIMNLHPTIHWGFNVLVVVVSVLVCYGAAWAPARRASLVEPVRAFRGQLT